LLAKPFKIILLFILAAFCFSTPLEAIELKNDVRVIVDISGSMKKNDPQNLRQPAVRLISNLLPENSKAGIWTFGKYTNMLVKHGQVDDKWKALATQLSNQINSAGSLTNIGDAVERASKSWSKPDPDAKRSIILLTDGMVDISKSAAENERERQRIIDVLLPKLKKQGVTVHTIALSDGADKELMAMLAGHTDGWFEAVADASELQKVFLKIFAQAAPRDSVPLTDNKFKVDSSIDEFTILVFKKSGSEKAKLVSPDQNILEEGGGNPNAVWFSDSGYELITVKNPQAGEWGILADVDPDNRVMVVSDLKLRTPDIPNTMLANEIVNYAAALLQEGKIIDKSSFLELVEFKLEVKSPDGIIDVVNLNDRGQEGDPVRFDGEYATKLDVGKLAGTLEVKLIAESPTFERSRQYGIQVAGDPFDVETVISQDESKSHQFVLKVREDIVIPRSLFVTAKITMPSGETVEQSVSEGTLKKRILNLDNMPSGGVYQVEFRSEGESQMNRKFFLDSKTYTLETPRHAGFAEPVEIPEVKPDPVPVKEEPVKEEPVVEEPVAEEPVIEKTEEDDVPSLEEEGIEEESSNWWLWGIMGLLVNIILIGGGWLVAKELKKKSALNAEKLAAKLEGRDVDEGSADASNEKRDPNQTEIAPSD
jgi:uncharacterized protein (TIGR03503 family)